MYFDGNPMRWDGTGMNCYGMGWDGTEENVPWTSLAISQEQKRSDSSIVRTLASGRKIASCRFDFRSGNASLYR